MVNHKKRKFRWDYLRPVGRNDQVTTWMNLQGFRLSRGKKPIPKGCMLYYSIYITSLKWQKYRGGETIIGFSERVSVLRGLGRKEAAVIKVCSRGPFVDELFSILSVAVNTQTYMWWNCREVNIHTYAHTNMRVYIQWDIGIVSGFYQCQYLKYNII